MRSVVWKFGSWVRLPVEERFSNHKERKMWTETSKILIVQTIIVNQMLSNRDGHFALKVVKMKTLFRLRKCLCLLFLLTFVIVKIFFHWFFRRFDITKVLRIAYLNSYNTDIFIVRKVLRWANHSSESYWYYVTLLVVFSQFFSYRD